jgi:transketolase
VPWRERYAARRDGLDRAPVTVTVEAGVTSGWAGLADGGPRVGIDRFGASGPAADVLADVGLVPEAVAARAGAAVRAHRARGTGRG